MTDEPTAGADPAAAFGVLADETRLGIMEALARDPRETLTFSELREAVGATDSGRFNYHLGKLVERFVARSDDGYQLTTAGHQVYGAILAGTYGGSAAFEPSVLAESCPRCGGRLETRYEDEHLGVHCRDCERLHVTFSMPPGALEGRSPEGLASLLDRRLRATVELVREGSCPLCWGPMEGELVVDSTPDIDAEMLLVSFDCPRCSERLAATPGALLLSEPAVVAAYHETGIDLRDQPLWSIPWLRQSAAEIVERDPLRARVTVSVGDRTLVATIEPDATVSGVAER